MIDGEAREGAEGTTPDEIEGWLREQFPGAEIEFEVVDRSPDPSFEQSVAEERATYHLFRIQQAEKPRIQIAVTTLAFERLSEPRLRAGVRRAIESAVRDGKKHENDRYIVTSTEVIFRETKPGRK